MKLTREKVEAFSSSRSLENPVLLPEAQGGEGCGVAETVKF